MSECSLISLAVVPPQESVPARRRRVPAMAPDERRAALVAATLPLLRQFGTAVTTRQIAEAAGVAEGTIFNAFPDKTSLILASMLTAFNPEHARHAMQGLAGDLRSRLVAAVDLLADRFEENGQLVSIAHALPAPAAQQLFEHLVRSRQALHAAIVELIEPDRALLRSSPDTAARLLLSLIFAASRDQQFGSGETLTSDELVAVLLDGLLIQNADTGSAT
jgi:AcrR family transcriptional regulator